MSASALLQQNHGVFANSLINFADALFGPPGGGGRATDYPRTRALAEAIGAASASQDVAAARISAYRALVGKFLRASPAEAPASDPAAFKTTGRTYKFAQTDADLTLVALRQLAPVERATLLLIVVERFSYADAAAVMDVEVSALIDALARGREAYAARLACAKGGGRSHLQLVG